jgi:hypothetical protein
MLFIYCDPKLHGQDTYDKVLEVANEACHDYNLTNRDSDSQLIFVITKKRDMMYVAFPESKGPQAMFFSKNPVNFMETHL